MKTVYSCVLLMAVTFVGAKAASAQRASLSNFENNDGYVSLLFGGNLGGGIGGGTLTASSGGTSASLSVSGLTQSKGVAGGAEAGWYAGRFGVELEDIVAKGGLAPSNVTLSGSALGGGSLIGTLDQFNATQNYAFVNGLLRFPKETTWGIWYPYMGAGFGFVAGSISNATTGQSGFTLNSRPAGELKFGTSLVRNNGLGVSAEYQLVISGFSMGEPAVSTGGVPVTSTLSGTAVNSILNVGVSYNFHL